MSYVGYPQSPQLQAPKIRTEAIGEAWALLKEKMGVWVATSLLYFVLYFGVSWVASLVMGKPATPTGTPSVGYYMGIMGQSFGQSILAMVVSTFFLGGIIRMALKQVRGEEISVGDLFSAGDVILPMLGSMFLIVLFTYAILFAVALPAAFFIRSQNVAPVILLFLVAMVAMVMLSARTLFANTAVVDRRAGAWGSIVTSWNALNGQTMNAFLLMFVLGLIMMAGMLACGVGLLFAFPLYPLTIAILYRDFFDTERGMANPSLDMPLPPSSAYYNSRFDAPTNQPGQTSGQMPGQAPPPINPPQPPSSPGEMPRL